MKKFILNPLICLSLFCATNARAQETPVQPPQAEESLPSSPGDMATPASTEPPSQEEISPDETPSPSHPREVGRASTDGADMAKQKNLGNIVIALLAIAVAATAIILVSRNEGKHP